MKISKDAPAVKAQKKKIPQHQPHEAFHASSGNWRPYSVDPGMTDAAYAEEIRRGLLRVAVPKSDAVPKPAKKPKPIPKAQKKKNPQGENVALIAEFGVSNDAADLADWRGCDTPEELQGLLPDYDVATLPLTPCVVIPYSPDDRGGSNDDPLTGFARAVGRDAGGKLKFTSFNAGDGPRIYRASMLESVTLKSKFLLIFDYEFRTVAFYEERKQDDAIDAATGKKKKKKKEPIYQHVASTGPWGWTDSRESPALAGEWADFDWQGMQVIVAFEPANHAAETALVAALQGAGAFAAGVKLAEKPEALIGETCDFEGEDWPALTVQVHRAMLAVSEVKKQHGAEHGIQPWEVDREIDDPGRLAEEIRRGHKPPLRNFSGVWHVWRGCGWESIKKLKIDAAAREIVEKSLAAAVKTGQKKKKVTCQLMGDALAALAALPTVFTEDGPLPRWADPQPEDPPANDLAPFANGLYKISTRQLLPATPRFLNMNWSEADYVAGDLLPAPVWNAYIKRSLGPAWRQQGRLIHEFLGYLLTQDTSRQVLLYLIGPTRVGKGVLLHVAEEIVGKHGYEALLRERLGSRFALGTAAQKSLITIPDLPLERGSRDSDGSAIEMLLSLVGADSMPIEKKYLDGQTVKPSARLMISANGLPRLRNTSGALAARCHFAEYVTTIPEDQRDPDLFDKLKVELPAITQRAVRGLHRLREHGFTLTSATKKLRARMELNGSPVRQFAKDCCVIEEGEEAPATGMYSRYKRWCAEQKARPVSASALSEDLIEAFGLAPPQRKRYGDERRFTWTGIGIGVGASAYGDDD